MANNSDIVFTPAARQAQAERGSAGAYDKRIAAGFPDRVTARACGLHRRSRHRIPRDRLGRRRALHPASRRSERLHQGHRRQDARLRRLRRQSAVHHHRQSRRERSRLSVPARFCRATADQDLGARACRRRRSGVAGAARRSRLPRPARARDPVHGRGLGRELLAAHHRALHRDRDCRGDCSPARSDRGARNGERAAAGGGDAGGAVPPVRGSEVRIFCGARNADF